MTGSQNLMKSDRREPSRSTSPRRRLAVGVTLAVAVLSLAGIPAATARTDHATASSAAGKANAGTSAAATAPAASGTELESPTPVKDASKRSKHATVDSGSAKVPAPGGAAVGSPAAAHPPAHTKAPARAHLKRKQAGGEGGGENESAAEAGAGGGVEAAAVSLSPSVKKKGKGPKAKEKAKEQREAAKEAREARRAEREGKSPPAGKGTTPAPVATPGPSEVASVASLAATSPTTATTADPPASSGTIAPSIERSRSQGATHHQRGPRRGLAAGTAPRGSAPAALAGVSAIALAHARTAGHAAARHASKPPGAAAPQSPIARTITRIVDVVPMPVRLLIAALLALALALAVRSGIVALRSRRLERQREQLLEDVGLLQAALLPAPPARLGPVGTSVAYRPAAGPGAGGDFYDVFALEDGQVAVIVGDISGHGREALPHTALVRFTLRAYLEAGLSPRDALQTAGNVLEHQLGGLFATVVAAKYNPRERMLVYACAGHPRPLVMASPAQSRSIAPTTVCSAPPIGVGLHTGIRQTVVSVPGHAQACFFTDGVVEARVGGELFGAERLADALAALGPQATASALLDRVADETDRRPDDMAACVLSIEGGAGSPSIVLEELELDQEEVASDRPEHLLLAYGVAPEEIAGLISAARAEVRQNGSVILELHLNESRPQLALRRDNVSLLQPRRASWRERLRVSL